MYTPALKRVPRGECPRYNWALQDGRSLKYTACSCDNLAEKEGLQSIERRQEIKIKVTDIHLPYMQYFNGNSSEPITGKRYELLITSASVLS